MNLNTYARIIDHIPAGPIFRFLYKLPYQIRDVKWRWQRSKQGWCEVDWWNMNSYLLKIINNMLYELRTKGHGYPAQYNSPEEWYFILDELIYRSYVLGKMDEGEKGFKMPPKSKTIVNLIKLDKEKAKTMKPLDCQKAQQEAFFKLFVAHFNDFWD